MHFITSVKYLNDYKLLVNFEDGIQRLIDLEPYLEGEIFEPLKNINYFKTVKADPELDTIVWDNGADFAPEFLYSIGAPVAEPVQAS
jgi:hypothetical protein